MPRLSPYRIGKAIAVIILLGVIIYFIWDHNKPEETFPQVRDTKPNQPAQIIHKRQRLPPPNAARGKWRKRPGWKLRKPHKEKQEGHDGGVPQAKDVNPQAKDGNTQAKDVNPHADTVISREFADADGDNYSSEWDLKQWMASMDEKIAERKANLKEMCEKTYKKKFLSWDELASNPGRLRPLIVNDDHHFIYSIVYKVGSTNWERVIVEDLGGFKNVPNQRLYSHKALKWFPKFSSADAKERLQSYTKFMFVRDPLSRILSGYKDKFVDHHNEVFTKMGKFIIKEYRTDSSTSPNITFTEFIRYLVAKEGHRSNVHWKPIHTQNFPCLVEYDVIGKLEEAHDDIPYVLKKVGIFDLTDYGKGPPKKTSSNLIGKYYSQLPKDLLLRLYEIYEPDFKLFGYDMPESFTVTDG